MIKKLWTQAINNLDSLLAILVSIAAAIYGVFSINQSPLLSAIAGTLGLLAYGIIKDRNARDELLKQLQQLREPPNIGTVFHDRSTYIPFNELTGSAQKICLVGPSVVNLFLPWSGYFQHTKLIEQGATIQAIILDPQSSAIETAAHCQNEPLEKLKDEIESTILGVRSILQSKDGVKNGKLELRTLPTYLNFSMVLVDPDKPSGKIIVEFIGYHSQLHNRPHIELTRSRDREWYQYFLQQYDYIYSDSDICLTSQQDV